MKKIILFALAAHGEGLSGGDRIFIEFARRWSKKIPVTIYVSEEGFRMCQRQKLNTSNIKYQISNLEIWKSSGFVINYIARIFEGIRIGLTFKLNDSQNIIVYSASEFWMDVFPSFILKLRFPKIRWVAAWYQTAPKPWVGFQGASREESFRFKTFLYWFSQLFTKPLISNSSNFVLVNNEEEEKEFPKLSKNNRSLVVLGAVDITKIQNWKSKFRNLLKIFDAVFQGRLHPQKGTLELVDIWRMVVDKKPNAKLAVIGDGPLMEKLRNKISNLKLDDNVRLFGYLFDGPEKYRIFSQSKIVVHPSYYDSGGIAAAEAMAFGLPCIGFNLKAYQSYYPKGMIKVKLNDKRAFADQLVKMLDNGNYRNRIGKEFLDMIKENWSWDKRASEVLSRIVYA